MYSNRSKKFLKSHEALNAIEIEQYSEIIGSEKIQQLKDLAELLQGKKWNHVNSTFDGGGVAEMLKSVIPIASGLGIDCEWHCIEATEHFYSITKRFHNIIQGLDQKFTLEELLDLYVNTNKNNFKNKRLVADMTIVHDPQPCASIVHGHYEGKMIWRCHIDTSEANELIWNFLLPYINNYDGVVFSHQSFAKEGIRKPVYQIPPAIDPLMPKNRRREEKESLDTINDLCKTHGIDPERPIVLAVSRYDIHKNQKTIINAFKSLKTDRKIKSLKPQLIIIGNSASDDPEGMEMYQSIQDIIDGDKDIHALLNIPNNDENIGAFLRLADVFIHVSTKEGFGLVVTEAMWQGTPVIGSQVGGITMQVLNDKTGFLVSPMDENSIKTFTKYILLNPEEREKMGYHAIEHVREHFLVTSLVKRYLILMRFMLGIDFPYFRI